ncbi:hypothetical protein EVAR_3138_1 [Eumeta japonica]|uniref:Uncharacterized protein n=1 Tax=Eumeta variegata TaxID=151549 RepID=A0A4C1XEX3_EUMVA|nr:hypothetical protein EVAR_3138_1 [Eumeta japonica]
MDVYCSPGRTIDDAAGRLPGARRAGPSGVCRSLKGKGQRPGLAANRFVDTVSIRCGAWRRSGLSVGRAGRVAGRSGAAVCTENTMCNKIVERALGAGARGRPFGPSALTELNSHKLAKVLFILTECYTTTRHDGGSAAADTRTRGPAHAPPVYVWIRYETKSASRRIQWFSRFEATNTQPVQRTVGRVHRPPSWAGARGAGRPAGAPRRRPPPRALRTRLPAPAIDLRLIRSSNSTRSRAAAEQLPRDAPVSAKTNERGEDSIVIVDG